MRGVVVGMWFSGLLAAACSSDRSCGDIEDDARRLVESHQSCTADGDCVTITVQDSACLPRLQCPVAVNESTDLDQFLERVSELAGEHRSSCSYCRTPLCSATAPAVCVKGLCTTP